MGAGLFLQVNKALFVSLKVLFGVIVYYSILGGRFGNLQPFWKLQKALFW